jgi:hypothetical protein
MVKYSFLRSNLLIKIRLKFRIEDILTFKYQFQFLKPYKKTDTFVRIYEYYEN